MNLEVNNRFTEMTINETMTTDGGKGMVLKNRAENVNSREDIEYVL